MKNHKKLISVLLVLALVLTLCVSFAFASTGIVPKNLEYMDLKIKLNGEIITLENIPNAAEVQRLIEQQREQ